VASSSGARWRLACDACEASAWVGPAAAGYDVWCESCQTAARLPAPPTGQRCERCGAPYSAAPRFVELYGELQHLDAVLGAWAGDLEPLASILPERPRYLTDLEPPAAIAGDPFERRVLLAAVHHGEWHAVLAAAEDANPRALASRAIALERLGEGEAAIAGWSRVLEAGEDARARLARGALLARAGRHDEAARDFALTGDRFEARWDRAALALERAVAEGEGLPDAATLLRARSEAGEPSAYWSDPTVGRLLWTLLVERAHALTSQVEATNLPGLHAGFMLELLRAAEAEFEHSTFWDRAMQLLGWARLGALDDVARIAAPLAREQSAELLDEPSLTGAPLLGVTQAVAAARSAMDMGDPVEARHDIHDAFARDDLRRFRIPCAACGRGSIGIEETAEAAEETD
jgi:tetratricopeptide (TPR) repeat protein